MANVAIRIEARPTFRDIQGKFARANDALLAARRDELRSEGRVLVQLVQGGIRRKVAPYRSASLESGIRFNTRQTGETISLNVTAPAKARPHRIAARNARALAFFWPRVGMQVFVPKRGGFRTHVRNGALMVGKGYVSHPGGSLVPLLEPILEDAQDEWMRTRGGVVLRRISTRWQRELTR
jgi:hypothetical protein